MLKAWCEVRTGRTPGPSDVAEERMRPCRAQWGHDLSMGRTLEKPGPALYSPECVEGGFSEVQLTRRCCPAKVSLPDASSSQAAITKKVPNVRLPDGKA